MLKEFMQDYCAAFRPGNAQQVAQFYQAPLLLVLDGTQRVLGSHAELISVFDNLLRGLAQRDFQLSKIDRFESHAVAAHTYFVSAAMTRYRIDNTVLEHIGATYTLLRTDSGFKIIAAVAHDASRIIHFSR